jgi:hypothetical protein
MMKRTSVENFKFETPACAKPLRHRQAKPEKSTNAQNSDVPNRKEISIFGFEFLIFEF